MHALRGARSRLSIPAACAVMWGLLAPGAGMAALMHFRATAYTKPGITASGTGTHEGIVAADPDVLPLGSRIRIHGAGEYDGVYVVRDTGRKIQGRAIDLYLADDREAQRFGRRAVKVELLGRGRR